MNNDRGGLHISPCLSMYVHGFQEMKEEWGKRNKATKHDVHEQLERNSNDKRNHPKRQKHR